MKKKPIIGWIESVALPDLQVLRIRAKADTGARTSALHAEHIRVHAIEDGRHEVSFTIYPSTKSIKKGVRVTCPLKESRLVKSSTGLATLRPVIWTTLRIGDYEKRIEVTLINRAPMEFRMLLGRSALREFLVDPKRSYLLTSSKGSRP